MDLRTTYLLHLRPDLAHCGVNDHMSEDELFQNQILRPILRVQNPVLLETFQHYIRKHKNLFHDLSVEKQLKYIEKAIQRDTKLRNTLKGMVIGLFTEKEYTVYLDRTSAINKRLMHLITERLQDQMQYFCREDASNVGSYELTAASA